MIQLVVGRLLPAGLALHLAATVLSAASAGLPVALDSLRAVGPEGAGNAAAQAAWKTVADAPPSELPRLLAAMDGANDYSLNWIRSAVDVVVDRAAASRAALPAPQLEAFTRDVSHHPKARHLAYEILLRADPSASSRLLPGLENDPAPPLRRIAVQRLIDRAVATAASAGESAEARARYREALAKARDVDQIEVIAARLRDLGDPVDLATTLGWVTRWQVIGPFDNAGGGGFDRVYPPEEGIDLKASLPGKSGPVRWQELTTRDDYGKVDLNQPFTALKGVAGYAYAEVVGDTERPVEIRLGTKNGWKVWWNGRFLFGRDEYHRGAEIDQYRLPVVLKPGRNTLLVKLCQNEQTEDWTVEWEFQLRITDALGTPIASTR